MAVTGQSGMCQQVFVSFPFETNRTIVIQIRHDSNSCVAAPFGEYENIPYFPHFYFCVVRDVPAAYSSANDLIFGNNLIGLIFTL